MTMFESLERVKRGRGRPKGSRNKPVLLRDDTLPDKAALSDYRHVDIDTMISRQLSLLDWAQQAVRNEMLRAYQAKGVSIDIKDIEKIETLSNAIVRAVDGLKKSSAMAEELASRLTPEQLLEAALKKIEGQDIPTLRYAIRRLRAHRDRIAPPDSKPVATGPLAASDAIASLGEDDE